jgi:hypothetical protein
MPHYPQVQQGSGLGGWGWGILQSISGIKKTGTSSPLADFLRFLRCSTPGASAFS